MNDNAYRSGASGGLRSMTSRYRTPPRDTTIPIVAIAASSGSNSPRDRPGVWATSAPATTIRVKGRRLHQPEQTGPEPGSDEATGGLGSKASGMASRSARGGGYFKMLTARAITRATMASEIADWTSIVIFAQRDKGITSVG